MDAPSDPQRMLTLRGRHRFSRYQLRLTLEHSRGDQVEIRAHTSAEFPGLPGRVYRTVVIGSRGHVLVTRWLVAKVAHRAEQGP